MHKPSVRVVRRDQLSDDTPQTPRLLREVAFDSRNPDAKVLSAFLSTVLPGAATGAHHHGDQETILYVLEGTARYRWGDRLGCHPFGSRSDRGQPPGAGQVRRAGRPQVPPPLTPAGTGTRPHDAAVTVDRSAAG